MIISSLQVNAVLKSQFGSKNAKSASCTERRPFELNTSDPSADLQIVAKAKKAVYSEAEVRKDRIETLKNMINQGNYPISGEVVADKMVNRSLVDSILSLKDDNTKV